MKATVLKTEKYSWSTGVLISP